MAKKGLYVSDVLERKDGEGITGWFVAVDVAQRRTKDGDLYLDFQAADKTGSISAHVWKEHFDQLLPLIEEGQAVRLTGVRATYKGIPQLSVSAANRQSEPPDPSEFLRLAPVPFDVLQQRFWAHVARITDAHCRDLVAELIGAPDQLTATGQLFFDIPAGPPRTHHDGLHGLLHHTVEVGDYVVLALKHHAGEFNADLALTGALLHDVGKVDTYTLTGVSWKKNTYGSLVDHVAGGMMLVQEAVRAINERASAEGNPEGAVPAEPRDALLHILASHHLRQEWGAVVPPRTPEAWVVAVADFASARLNEAAEATREPADADGWTQKNYMLDDQRIYTGPAGQRATTPPPPGTPRSEPEQHEEPGADEDLEPPDEFDDIPF
jgi:3'-5' exoribonuclease